MIYCSTYNVNLVRLAHTTKDEGNQFFKEGDFRRALAKYARVQCYTNALLPTKNGEVQMYQNMSKNSKVCENHVLNKL